MLVLTINIYRNVNPSCFTFQVLTGLLMERWSCGFNQCRLRLLVGQRYRQMTLISNTTELSSLWQRLMRNLHNAKCLPGSWYMAYSTTHVCCSLTSEFRIWYVFHKHICILWLLPHQVSLRHSWGFGQLSKIIWGPKGWKNQDLSLKLIAE